MNKTASIIITLGLIAAIGVIFMGGSNEEATRNNVGIKNGIQYVTINAGGGYYPNLSSAQAGIPTKLIVKTRGVYDCSSALFIPSINYQNILPQTGDTEIDIGIPQIGEPLRGICGMGMYNFAVNFD